MDDGHVGQIKGSTQHNQQEDLQHKLESDPNLKRSCSETSLNQRKRHERSDNDPQPSSYSQVSRRKQNTDYSKVNDRLDEFVTYFVQEFEAKLQFYNLIFEGKEKKDGKFSDAFSEKVGQVSLGGAGGLIGFFLGLPAIGAKLGAEAGKEIGGKLGSKIGGKHHKYKATHLVDLVNFSQKDKSSLRLSLVEAAFDVFQGFEMQFMRVTTDQGTKRAMQLLAKDATNRAINYMKEKKETSIGESVILGESKKEAVHSISPGFEIQYKYQSSKMVWNTANLYEKAGVVIENRTSPSYYKRKDGKSGTSKYGYRRLLVQESWKKLKEKFDYDNIAESKSGQFTDYQYVLSPRGLEEQSKNIFNNLNRKDNSLQEHRIKEVLQEVKKDILDEINILLKLSHGFIEDRKILANIQAYVKNLGIDEHLKKFEQRFEEAKNEHQKIAKSIETNREENRENFKQLNQKQDIYHEDSKERHQKTQEGIERVEHRIQKIIEVQNNKELKKSIWFDVKGAARLFTGRMKKLEELHATILRDSEQPTALSQITLVSGLGGIGKTELARRYIEVYGKNFYYNVIWVNAESELALVESFTRLAKDKLKIKTKDANGREKDITSVIEEVYTFFSDKKSLFIFDNAERSGYFNKILTLYSSPQDSKSPYILITSQNREWGNGIEPVDLKELELEDAVEFVKKGLSIKNKFQDQEIKNLVEKLQRFPLAIQQAVAYIEDQRITREFTIDDYLDEYNKKAEDLLNSEVFISIDNYYEKTTFTTWKLAIDKIACDKEHGKLALEILNTIAYLAPESIHREMFLELAAGDEKKLRSAVRLCVKYSMINGEKNQSLLSVHRLVQEVMRLNLREQNKEEKVIEQAFKIIKRIFPYGSYELEDQYKKRELLPHLEASLFHIDNWLINKPEYQDKIERAYLEDLLVWIGHGYNAFGDPKKQKEVLERVLIIKKKHYGTAHLEVAETLCKLSNAYEDLGDPNKQKELLENALPLLEQHYGLNHFELAKVFVNLSGAYGELGDTITKKKLLERALKIEEKHFGPEHPEVAATLVNLGNAYGSLGDPMTKKELSERALKIQERHYGVEHYAVALNLVSLSTAYGALDNRIKQMELLEKALPILEKHYGPKHFKVAATLVKLGNAYRSLGDPLRQKEMLERALMIEERHYGLEHYAVALTLVSLSTAYGALDNRIKEKELLEKALPILEKHYGPEHFQVATTLVHLGNAYGSLGDPMTKKELLERALPILEKHYGPEHFQIASILNNLSDAYGALDDRTKQKELLERALPILEKHYGPEHFKVATTLVNLGNAYGSIGDPIKKKKSLERALSVLEKRYGLEHFKVALTLNNLSNAYGALRNPIKQKELIERALPILEKHYGPKHVNVAATLVNLGNAYGDLGDTVTKKELLERALEIEEEQYGRGHLEVASTLISLGMAYGTLGKPAKKIELLERALVIEQNHYGVEHVQVATTLVILGDAYGALGYLVKQKDLLEKALPILENYYGLEHLKIAEILVELGHVNGALGNLQKASELYEKSSKITKKQTPLHLATRSGHLETVEYILGKGADILLENNHDTVLHQAVSSGNGEVIKLILHKIQERDRQHFSTHVNAKDTEGDTPLMWAAQNGKTNAAKLLLTEYEVDINLQNNDGETALHWAAKNGHQEVLQLLLDKQANPNIQDSKGKTPLDLAQEKLDKDPENDSLKTITALLLSLTDKYEHQEEDQRPVLLEQCLPSTSPGRSKREAKIRDCELSWEDVDEFNAEKDENRQFTKIKIDSEKFVNYIKHLPEAKQCQLVQLADKVQVTGESQSLVSKLILNQKVMNHLNRVGKISGTAMQGMMAKNILADFLNGDDDGLAINFGFIAGSQGFAKVAEFASFKGIQLSSEGKLALGRSLRAASPFLARGTSAFVVYDLVNQLKAFKNGTEEALVGAIGDSIYLGVDAAEIGIEVAEAFEVLDGVSSATGPIGATIGAVVFMGTDIYMAIKRVDKINQLIHLTGKERFIEGLRALLGMKPDDYVQMLLQDKEVSNGLVRQGLQYLKHHSAIQSYVFSTGKSVVGSCRKVPYKVRNCASGGFGGGCFRSRSLTRYAKECSTKFEIDLDSTVLLDRKRTNVKWSRAKPDDPSNGILFCLPRGNDIPPPSNASYICENAIGLSSNNTGNYNLINLGNGKDYAKGFLNNPNIFVVNNGFKEYYGGNEDDIFVLQTDFVKGYLSGQGGVNTLDTTSFNVEEEPLNIQLHKGEILHYSQDSLLQVCEINKVTGRENVAETITVSCDGCNSNVQLIDGQGGSKEIKDRIIIENDNCTYRMQIIVRPNTIVYNRAVEGSFDYVVPLNNSGSAELSFSYGPEKFNVNNTFWFAYKPVDLKDIDLKYVNVFNRTEYEVKFSFVEPDNEFNVTISYPENPSYRLGNYCEIRIGNNGNLYMLQSSNRTAEEIIKNYLPLANRLNKMSFFLQSLLSNETVVIGSGNYEVIQNDPEHKSHLVGNGGENVYVIDSRTDKLPEVIIYDFAHENLIDTIDLRHVVKKVSCELQVIQSENDLLLRACAEKPKGNSSIKEEYFTVRLKDRANKYYNIHVIAERVPMTINVDNNEWSLKPLPLIFGKDKEMIIVTDEDVEKDTKLIIPRKGGNYTFVRDKGINLLITNAFDSSISKDDLCTITLSKFFKIPMMKTLSIKFSDKEIVLKNRQEDINTARNLNIMKREYKDKVYDDVFQRYEQQNATIRHRRHKKLAISNFNEELSESVTSSSRRPSLWINDLFYWVKSSIGGLRNFIQSRPTMIKSPTSQVAPMQDTPMDLNGTILLLDVLLRKVTGEEYVISENQHVSLLEAQGCALNITERLEKVVEKFAVDNKIAIYQLNVNFVEIQRKVIGKIISGKFCEIFQVLKSYIDKAFLYRKVGKVNLKKFNKFLAELNKELDETLNQFVRQVLHNRSNIVGDMVERKVNLEPCSCLRNPFVQGYLTMDYDIRNQSHKSIS